MDEHFGAPALPAPPAARATIGSGTPTVTRTRRVVTVAIAVVLLAYASLVAVALAQGRTIGRLSASVDGARDAEASLTGRIDATDRAQTSTAARVAGLFDPELVVSRSQGSVFTLLAGPWLGSAFVVASDDRGSTLITNFHVVRALWDRGVHGVVIRNADTSFNATIRRVWPDADLAVVHVSAPIAGPRDRAELGARGRADRRHGLPVRLRRHRQHGRRLGDPGPVRAVLRPREPREQRRPRPRRGRAGDRRHDHQGRGARRRRALVRHPHLVRVPPDGGLLKGGSDMLPIAPVPEVVPAPRRRVPWVKVIASAIVAAAFVAAVGINLSTKSSLGSARDQLSETGAQLAQTQKLYEGAKQEIAQVQASLDQTSAQFGDALATTHDLRKSLNACQNLWRMAARYSNGRVTPPPNLQAQIASGLVSCFEGQLPPSIFP